MRRSALVASIAAAAASYDTCETQWAVLHFDPATAKITRNNLGGRGPDPSSEAVGVVSPKGWLSSWLWGKD